MTNPLPVSGFSLCFTLIFLASVAAVSSASVTEVRVLVLVSVATNFVTFVGAVVMVSFSAKGLV